MSATLNAGEFNTVLCVQNFVCLQLWVSGAETQATFNPLPQANNTLLPVMNVQLQTLLPALIKVTFCVIAMFSQQEHFEPLHLKVSLRQFANIQICCSHITLVLGIGGQMFRGQIVEISDKMS